MLVFSRRFHDFVQVEYKASTQVSVTQSELCVVDLQNPLPLDWPSSPGSDWVRAELTRCQSICSHILICAVSEGVYDYRTCFGISGTSTLPWCTCARPAYMGIPCRHVIAIASRLEAIIGDKTDISHLANGGGLLLGCVNPCWLVEWDFQDTPSAYLLTHLKEYRIYIHAVFSKQKSRRDAANLEILTADEMPKPAHSVELNETSSETKEPTPQSYAQKTQALLADFRKEITTTHHLLPKEDMPTFVDYLEKTLSVAVSSIRHWTSPRIDSLTDNSYLGPRPLPFKPASKTHTPSTESQSTVTPGKDKVARAKTPHKLVQKKRQRNK